MDERERDRQAIFGAVYGVMKGVNGGEAWQIATTKAITDAVLRAGVSPSTGEDRLREAAEAVAFTQVKPPNWLPVDADALRALQEHLSGVALTPTGDTPKEPG